MNRNGKEKGSKLLLFSMRRRLRKSMKISDQVMGMSM